MESKRAIAGLEARVENSPRREQEMVSLTRDYENLKLSYDDLLKKKLDAEVSQNLEKRQKGEQFQILDPANLPQKPFSPESTEGVRHRLRRRHAHRVRRRHRVRDDQSHIAREAGFPELLQSAGARLDPDHPRYGI